MIDPNFPIESTGDVADSATPGESTEPEATPDSLTVHPFADEYSDLPANERPDMAADIKRNGLKHRIVLYQGKILDGRTRHSVCLEYGIPLNPGDFIEFIGDDQAAQAFVHSSNLFRRHLTAAERREKIAKALLADPKRSDRQIAGVAKVHHETVAAARADLERRGEIVRVERRKDTKGRSYSARGGSETKTSSARAAIDLAAKRKADAVIAFSQVLHEGDINLHLNTVLKILGDEKERITELPKVQRESFVRGVLAVVDLTLDDLRPIVSTPMFH